MTHDLCSTHDRSKALGFSDRQIAARVGEGESGELAVRKARLSEPHQDRSRLLTLTQM